MVCKCKMFPKSFNGTKQNGSNHVNQGIQERRAPVNYYIFPRLESLVHEIYSGSSACSGLASRYLCVSHSRGGFAGQLFFFLLLLQS